MKEENFESVYTACEEFGFNKKLTAEQCWNRGYALGRARWHWGPWWMVNVTGWVNTRIYRFKSIFRRGESQP